MIILCLCLCILVTDAGAQAIGPSSIRTSLSPDEAVRVDRLYSSRPPFVIGWNWASMMRQANEDLRTNVVHTTHPWVWDTTVADPSPQRVLQSFPDGTQLILSPGWHVDHPRLPPDIGMGMRFEPELPMNDTVGFIPRTQDRQGAVWGFLQRDTVIGRVPTKTTDPNYHRMILRRPSDRRWHTVLSQSWPQQQFASWIKDADRSSMYVAINLRRLLKRDTRSSTDTVLRIRLHYRTCNDDDAESLIRFDSLPDPTSRNVPLPRTLDGISRGLRRPLREIQQRDSTTDLIITRNMIPAGNATDRDVTILAHFNLEENRSFRDRWNIGNGYTGADVIEHRIDRLWAEVDYRGTCDVAIDWVQIGTEKMTRLMWGEYDEVCRNVYLEIADRLDRYNGYRFSSANDTNRLRLWRWYNRDEGPEAWWNAMGYVHRLFDEKTIVELDIHDHQERFAHSTGMTERWDGATVKITPSVLAPFYRRGFDGVPSRRSRYLGFRNGVDDTFYPSDIPMDYELNAGNVTGLQGAYEQYRAELRDRRTFLFDNARPWLANVWLSGDMEVNVDTFGVPDDTMLLTEDHSPRMLTGEEASLLCWSNVILGAKGLMFWWGANQDSTTTHAQVIAQGFISPGIAYGPSRSERRTSMLHNLPARDEKAGPDWLEADNATGLWQLLQDENTIPLQAALDNLYGDRETGKYYLGWLSVRSSLQAIADTLIQRADLLSQLSLRAWHCRGLRSWTSGDIALLSRVVDTSAVRTRHPVIGSWDAADSTFIELTILQVGTDSATDSTVVIGILNRRCDPFDINNNVEFITYEMQRQRSLADPSMKYRQRGAREIEIPLRTRYNGGRTEPLRITLMPGEGTIVRLNVNRNAMPVPD